LAPRAFRVRVWQITSRGRGPGARRTPLEDANVGYALAPVKFETPTKPARPDVTTSSSARIVSSNDVSASGQ